MAKSKKIRAEVFRFCGYEFDEDSLTASFFYKFEFADREGMSFCEKIVLPEENKTYNKELFDRVLDSLQIVLGISYFKLYFPKRIECDLEMHEGQAKFWNDVYEKGLGEYMYMNGLKRKDLAKFESNSHDCLECIGPIRSKGHEGILLGIGGGKDSIVAGELLKQAGAEVTAFMVETQRKDEIGEEVVETMGVDNVKIKRILDSQIFESYEDGYNGHVPISAVFAFLGLMCCAYYGKRYMVVGNEHSSNFGNIEYDGEMINHQWSKSGEFEDMLEEYVREFVSPDIGYFSALRQFYEIRIVEMFSEMKDYFKVFSSCNRSFKVYKERSGERWCRECSKCGFVFLMFAAFMNKDELVRIFGGNMLDDGNLIGMFEDLCGYGDVKPFDCVGTFEESRVAMVMASERFGEDKVVKSIIGKINDIRGLKKKVFSTSIAKVLPPKYRFLGVKSVGILGYGKEGEVSERFLKKFHPDLEVGILDKASDENYLDKQSDFDLLIKTPGIAKRMVEVAYTTGTNMFFSKVKNFTIGITGSKGKSTTSTLIYEMIKASGKKVRLLGNIGHPMLEYVLDESDEEEILVLELSSYMLDDIRYSPNIALLINLFPEHMDYHGGVEKYYEAKRNIFKFQGGDDEFVQLPFDDEIPMGVSDIPLLGEHNHSNIRAAIKVVRKIGVDDEAIKAGILNFKPLPHRLEFVGNFKGIDFYDDAISTTPQSTIEAIKAVKNVQTIFLGGTDRGYDFGGLEKVLRESSVKNIVLFPDSGQRILTSRDGFNVRDCDNMDDAVSFAFSVTEEGKACLLSTASPSYSLWKNFEEKGDTFQRLVKG